jgi:MFS family permease
MADIFGRHTTLQASMVIMLIGSALCTGAPRDAFPVLLLGRGIQGLSCAGLNVIVRTIVADKVSLRENSVNWSIFSIIGGISFGLGPVAGGKCVL